MLACRLVDGWHMIQGLQSSPARCSNVWCSAHIVSFTSQVHIVVDAVSSQRTTDRAAGLHRAAQSGAFLVTSEMALFQLMQVRGVGVRKGLFCLAGCGWQTPGQAVWGLKFQAVYTYEHEGGVHAYADPAVALVLVWPCRMHVLTTSRRSASWCRSLGWTVLACLAHQHCETDSS